MAKCILEFLDVDEKTAGGRPTHLTFCCRVEVSQNQHNTWLIKNLEEQLTRCFFQALAEKGCVEEKDVAQYIPHHKPPVVKW